MKLVGRLLEIDLPPGQSAFLWGPRKTGKSTYLKAKFPYSLSIDFLKTDQRLEFTKNPALLRERLLAKDPRFLEHPVVLDEVQKVPQILDEVHWLMENKGFCFILCGSSARKLKRGRGNLLGGRAWRYELFPFVSPELRDLDILRTLNHGLIPVHYHQGTYERIPQSLHTRLLEGRGLRRRVDSEYSGFFQILRHDGLLPR